MIPDKLQPKEARNFHVKRRTMLKAAAACMLLPISACQASSTQLDNTTYSANGFVSKFSQLDNGYYTLNGINAVNLNKIPHSQQITVPGIPYLYAEDKLKGDSGYVIVIIRKQEEQIVFQALESNNQVTMQGEKTIVNGIPLFKEDSYQPS